MRILDSTGTLPVEEVALADALGRCLAAPVAATIAVPPWTNSAMDGYAVRAEDVDGASEKAPVALRVVAEIPAGSTWEPSIGAMEAARIMTGAPVPAGADTVIPHELTDAGLDTVSVRSGLERGRHIRLAGEDKKVGDPVIGAGVRLTPESLASIASAGSGRVRVARLPRVSVIATGDELLPPGEDLARGQIPDSNSLLLSSLVREEGSILAGHRRVGDLLGQLEAALAEVASGADVVIITGGVSVGAHDPVKELFGDGEEVRFDRVAMQPGKPQAFGRLSAGPLLFGLPGNPVSTWASFHVFVAPALRKLQNFPRPFPETVAAIARGGWDTPAGRTQILPARIEPGENGRRVSAAGRGGSGSHLVASLARANGYAVVPREVDRVESGDRLPTVMIREPQTI